MDREELHRRVELLRDLLREGKLHIAEHLVADFERSLTSVRIAHDGLVDPATVDGQMRSLLMMVAHQADRREWKEAVSLGEIQEAYFARVEHAFGDPFRMMQKAGAEPSQMAAWFSSEPNRVKDAIGVVDSFCTEIFEFWGNISEPAWIHLQDSFDKKAVFAGEIFPSYGSSIASSTGIYFDTTVLPDPFVKIVRLLDHMDEQERCREVLRLGLQVLQYKQLALADVPKPIVAILPDRHNLEEPYQSFVHSCAESDTLLHASRIFGRPMTSSDELLDFLRSFPSAESLTKALKTPGELIYATEWEGDLPAHIKRYLQEEGRRLGISSPGEAVYLNMISRFSQANDSFQRSIELMGTPVIRAETSWRWFDWMLRNNAHRIEGERLEELHVSRALESAVKTEIAWLGSVPPQAIIEIRKAGALEEIRGILGSGLSELLTTMPNNFFQTGDLVVDNLQKAFVDHEKKIRALRGKKWTFAGRDIGSFLVVGGIEIAAAITGIPLFGGAAAVAGMSGLVPTAKDLKEKVGQLRAEQSTMDSTGVGLLLKHKHKHKHDRATLAVAGGAPG